MGQKKDSAKKPDEKKDARAALIMDKLKATAPGEGDKNDKNKTERPQLIEFPSGAITLKMPRRLRFYLWLRFPMIHPYITATVLLSITIVATFTWLILDPPESLKAQIEAMTGGKKAPMATLAPQIPQAIRQEIDGRNQQQQPPQATYRRYMALARRYHAAEDHQNSLESYLSAIMIQPASYEAYNAAAAEATELKAYTQAEQYLKKAIQFNPSYALAHYNLGILYATMGDIPQAAEQRDILNGLDQTLAGMLERHMQAGGTDR